MFSRFFEAVKESGPEMLTSNVILAVNWTGLFFVSEQEEVLVSLNYNFEFFVVLQTSSVAKSLICGDYLNCARGKRRLKH